MSTANALPAVEAAEADVEQKLRDLEMITVENQDAGVTEAEMERAFMNAAELKVKHKGNWCADINWGDNGNVYIHPCHGGANQKVCRLEPAAPAQLGCDSRAYSPTLASQFFFTQSPASGGAQIKTQDAAHGGSIKCLDFHTGNNNLYFSGCHGGHNQKW